MEAFRRCANLVGICMHCGILIQRPLRGTASRRVHGREVQRLTDAPAYGAPMVIEVSVRRSKCAVFRCPAVAFTEQLAVLTSPHTRSPRSYEHY
ncbi:hypothetical protein [Streptomyces sp. NPDC056634]|uniref:hypothetical protein n=1 Tax=Streptomyces sp. NPDC056634 TaxID=3345885 RepID=UPI0036B83BC5